MKNLLLFLTVVTMALSSCSKEDKAAPTVLDLLTSGTWYLEKEGSITLKPCKKRINMTFSNNGKVTIVIFSDDGSSCVGGNPFVTDYTLTEDKYLKIGDNMQVEILKITNKELSYQTRNDDGYVIVLLDKTEG